MKPHFLFRTGLAVSVCLLQTFIYSQTLNTMPAGETSKQIRIVLGAGNRKTEKKEYNHVSIQQMAFTIELQAALLRSEAKTKPAAASRLIEEARNLEKTAMMLQIDAYELAGKQHFEQLLATRRTINALLLESNFDNDVYTPVKLLVASSERNIKLATEMREEANAEKRPAAKLGRLSNADEKELIAISEQGKAIQLLKNNKSLSLGSR